MESTYSKIEELAGSVKAYVNGRVELMKLQVADKSSSVISNLVAGMAVAVVFIFFLVFASTALALVLGEWMGKTWAGFLLVAGFYLVLGIIIWTMREKLIRLPVMNAIIKQLFSKDDATN